MLSLETEQRQYFAAGAVAYTRKRLYICVTVSGAFRSVNIYFGDKEQLYCVSSGD
jgi:hypothetical protein